jgi:chromosome partitioning protein
VSHGTLESGIVGRSSKVSTAAHGLGWPGQLDRADASASSPAGSGALNEKTPQEPAHPALPAAASHAVAALRGERGGAAGSAGENGLGWPAAQVSRGTGRHRSGSPATDHIADPPAGEVRGGERRDMPRSAEAAAQQGSGEAPARVADINLDTPIARAARAALAARAGSPAWPRPGACRIITIANQKGGVGKTTTAVNLAASMSLHGLRVLVIDLDPQGNASTALDVDHHSGTASIYNVLVDGQPLASVVSPAASIPQLYCVPATIDLAGAEIELVPLVARESRLVRALAGFDSSGLDYIFIDCPPSLGLLTVNALVAAPEVLIPIQCEYYALEGLEQLLRTVDLVRSHLNPGLSVSTILLTMFDGRTRLASQVADEVREHFGEIVLSSIIPRSVRVSEAPSYGQSVMTYDPGSSGAQAYLEAAREMAHRKAPHA